jgi:hypothetical protein
VTTAFRQGKRFPDRRVSGGGDCDADHGLQVVGLQTCVIAAHVWGPTGSQVCVPICCERTPDRRSARAPQRHPPAGPRSRPRPRDRCGQRQRESAVASLISDSARPLTSCQRHLAVSGPPRCERMLRRPRIAHEH